MLSEWIKLTRNEIRFWPIIRSISQIKLTGVYRFVFVHQHNCLILRMGTVCQMRADTGWSEKKNRG